MGSQTILAFQKDLNPHRECSIWGPKKHKFQADVEVDVVVALGLGQAHPCGDGRRQQQPSLQPEDCPPPPGLHRQGRTQFRADERSRLVSPPTPAGVFAVAIR